MPPDTSGGDLSGPLPAIDPQLEAELERLIEPWLAHMRWRADFTQWRYSRLFQENFQSEKVQDIKSILHTSGVGNRVLDLGSGMGGLSVALLLDLGTDGISLSALDYNFEYCRIAQLRSKRYGLNLELAVGAGERLPYPAGAFDLIICFDVLEHVASAEAVLNEIRRVLRPGGRCLTTVPNRFAFRDPHYHLPLINWLPLSLAEKVITLAGRSKQGGQLQDRQAHADLNSYSWGAFSKLARKSGMTARDRVRGRIESGELRQLTGIRKRLVGFVLRSRLAWPLYRIYRFGWQGTYQIELCKPD